MKPHFIVAAEAVLNKNIASDEHLSMLVEDLTLYPESSSISFGNAPPRPLVLVRRAQNLNAVCLPRAYPFLRFGGVFEASDETVAGVAMPGKWIGDAEHEARSVVAGRPDWAARQRAWSDAILAHIRQAPYHGAIGQAPTSFGKTISTMRIIGALGVSTVVLVHKDFQIGQWHKAAKEWLGLADDQLGVLQGDRADLDRPFLVAMVETVVSRMNRGVQKAFPHGLAVVDEAHRFGAYEWSQAMQMFPCRYRVGISATPRRRDGFDNAFLWSIGPIVVEEKDWYLAPSVHQVRYETAMSQGAFINHWNRKLNLAKLVSHLAGLSKLNVIIVRELVKAAQAGRRVIALSDRREHLRELKTAFDAVAGGLPSSFFWGSLPKKDIPAAEKAAVLFGTFGKAKEGLDFPWLDTLFLLTPRADVEQDCGRILRVHGGKKPPLVVDVVHGGLPVCEALAAKRRKFYQSKQYVVASGNLS